MKIKLQIINIYQMKGNFIHFTERFQKLDDFGFRGLQIDILQLGNFLHFFRQFGENRKFNFLHFSM